MSRQTQIIQIESEEGPHGTRASNVGGATYQMLVAQGAAVSDFTAGGNARSIEEKPIELRAFDMGGGMPAAIAPHSASNPAPRVEGDVAPVITLEGGRKMEPVAPEPVAASPVIASPGSQFFQGPVPSAPDQSAKADAVMAALSGAGRSATPKTNGTVVFMTPMGEFDFPCYFVGVDGQWLTLIGATFPKITADTTLDLKVNGKEFHCYSPGINVEIKLGDHTARVAHFLIIQKD